MGLRQAWAHARMGIAAILGCGLAASGANAGDVAWSQVIGFSADGRYVAFEEYGVQDGSGFPYANLYVIDVAANDWVAGSPIRILIDDTEMDEDTLWRTGVQAARERAMQQAQPVLASHGVIPGNTGITLVHHPLSDLAAAPHEASFSIGAAYAPDWTRDSNLLRLTERQASSAECERYDLGPTAIFTLELSRDGEAPVTLQRDTRLSASRNCPTRYRIHSVIAYAHGVHDQSQCCGSSYSMLVLIAMAKFGFEGSDWRYLGVTSVQPAFND